MSVYRVLRAKASSSRVGFVFRWALFMAALGVFSCGNESSNTGRNPGRASEEGEAGASSVSTYAGDAAAQDTSSSGSASAESLTSEEFSTWSEPTTVSTDSTTTSSTTFTSSTSTTSSTAPSPTPLFTPVEDPPGGLTGCTENVSAGSGACTHRLRCDQQSVWTNCYAAPEGGWQCSCLDYGSGRRTDFNVSEGEGSDVCRETYSVCIDGLSPLFPERTCVFKDNLAVADQCSRAARCGAEVELESGVVVDGNPQSFINSCYRDGDIMRCQCGTNYNTFDVTGADGTTACQALDQFCFDLDENSGEYECQPYGLSVNSESCQVDRLCGHRVQLDESGISALVNASLESVVCNNYGGEATCACSGPGYRYLRVPVVGANMLDNCRAAEAVCVQSEELEVTGPTECSSVSITAPNSKSCNVSATCGLGLRLGNSEVSMTGQLQLDCSSTAAGEWTCRCGSGQNTSEPFTALGNQVFDVCTAAKDTCSGMITGFAPNNYYYYPSFVFGPPPSAPSEGDAGL